MPQRRGSVRRLAVRVTPGAKRAGVALAEDGTLLVRVREPAQGGRANAALIQTVAEHFGVPRRTVTIVQGLSSRHKLLQIAA